jgi:hypothetical protein
MNEFLKLLLTSQGLGNFFWLLWFVFVFFLFRFRKGIIKNIIESAGIATKKDLDEAIYKLQAEHKADFQSLRVEQKADIQSIKENDLQHINNDILNLRKEFDYLRKDMDAKMELLRKEMEALRKAVLLLAQKYVDDPERLERIKDLLTI